MSYSHYVAAYILDNQGESRFSKIHARSLREAFITVGNLLKNPRVVSIGIYAASQKVGEMPLVRYNDPVNVIA